MKLPEQILTFWGDLDQRTRLRAGYALIFLLVAALGWSTLAGKVAGLEKKRKAREVVLKELLPLKVAYRSARQSSDLLAGRMASLRPDDSPGKIIEEIGIKGKGVKISPLKGEERNGISEDAADVRVEGLTFNEAVNLIYRLEKGSRPLVIRKCNLRVRFDDPSRCDLSMILALLKPAPVQAR
ncbi:MAG: general secretion pathway protein GspM [Geobacteraceae bacterium GWC2_55_20]|nr:MAG: general secretion pathway protein GspM [Geobacteraceae bacterium GWC2_55_20]OGU23687.1 MAG: general secretion pathway protein GspM [Geobacteraceae bacterium GWF2_54_21]HBA71578.1 general secretion pathway protein GspM [Geobacter sp.]HCE66360.1 general secretion pathway protein GspM [Geobacter sp.]